MKIEQFRKENDQNEFKQTLKEIEKQENKKNNIYNYRMIIDNPKSKI